MGRTSSARVTRARNVSKICNGTIAESKEKEKMTKLNEVDNVASNFSDTVFEAIPEDGKDIFELSCDFDTAKPLNGEIQQTVPDRQLEEQTIGETIRVKSTTGSPQNVDRAFSPKSNRRMRQESTSLYTHPIVDDDLQDFHQHRLLPGRHSLDIRYNLHSMVVRKILLYLKNN